MIVRARCSALANCPVCTGNVSHLINWICSVNVRTPFCYYVNDDWDTGVSGTWGLRSLFHARSHYRHRPTKLEINFDSLVPCHCGCRFARLTHLTVWSQRKHGMLGSIANEVYPLLIADRTAVESHACSASGSQESWSFRLHTVTNNFKVWPLNGDIRVLATWGKGCQHTAQLGQPISRFVHLPDLDCLSEKNSSGSMTSNVGS